MQDPHHNEWKSEEHAFAYLARADKLPHRTEGEKVLLEQIPVGAMRILDLGTGNGRLLALIRIHRPNSEGVALDYSEPMLAEAKKRFAFDTNVQIVKHDFALSLPRELGKFDAVVSSLAIHHCTDERKKELYYEIFGLLNSGGVFCNLEHVSSATDSLHCKFLKIIGQTPETEDKSNRLVDVETQLQWLRGIGFADVDCYWKWLEVALLVGFKP
jgi:tRNA (cmo5U34)-methyltransferase